MDVARMNECNTLAHTSSVPDSRESVHSIRINDSEKPPDARGVLHKKRRCEYSGV